MDQQSFQKKEFKNELLIYGGSLLFIYILLFIESYVCSKDNWFMPVINNVLGPMSMIAAVFALYEIKKFIRKFVYWLLLFTFFFGFLGILGRLFFTFVLGYDLMSCGE